MIGIQQQCQVRLEVEQHVLATWLQEAERLGESRWDDPIRQQRIRRLQSVERALARLTAGQYGVCQHCRQSIAAERLEARPDAELCVGCQGQVERTMIGSARLA